MYKINICVSYAIVKYEMIFSLLRLALRIAVYAIQHATEVIVIECRHGRSTCMEIQVGERNITSHTTHAGLSKEEEEKIPYHT